MALTERDAAVILRVFQCRLVPAQATYLFARAVDPTASGDNWSKRLRILYDAGWLSRFYIPQSPYLAGSQWPVYCVETGVAARAAELRRAWRSIDRPTRARLSSASAGMHTQILQLLTGRCGLRAEAVSAGLRASTDLALRLYSGEPCHAQHALLGATLTAILWHGLATAGLSPCVVLPDGTLDLSKAAGGTADALIPDMFFVVNEVGLCVEAETGASSRSKLREKIRRYIAIRHAVAALGDVVATTIRRLQVIFHCGTPAHKQRVAELIAEQAPLGTSLFLVSDATQLHVDYPHLHFRRNLPVSFGAEADMPLYQALASLTQRAVFAQVEGEQAGNARLGYVSFTDAVRWA